MTTARQKHDSCVAELARARTGRAACEKTGGPRSGGGALRSRLGGSQNVLRRVTNTWRGAPGSRVWLSPRSGKPLELIVEM